jgi:phosphomannomutase/phosphoglucomutase
VNSEIFREYDIRGRVGKDLTNETVDRVARGYAAYLARYGVARLIIGRDNRLSSEEFRNAAVAAFTDSGITVIDVGLVVTPIFYFSRVLYGVDGGMMITGSHNPPGDNGMKLTHGFGTLYGDEIQEIRRIVEKHKFLEGKGTVRSADPVSAYYADVTGRIKLGPRRLKVVVDSGNGTASLFAPELLRRLGADVIPLHCESDGHFPNHFPDPVKKSNLQDLIKTVRETGADLGVAFDGDADRIGVVDDQGGIIWGDTLMALYWREILAKHPGSPAIIEVKCSQALVDEVLRLGGKPFFYKTGHSLIKAKMQEIGAVFTGEMSGHMFFADEYYGYDDALYAAARLLRLLSNTDKRLSELAAEIPAYVSTPETRVDCPDSDKFRIVSELTSRFKETHEVIDVDGARVLAFGGWALVRASNTQPAMVLRCEAKTTELLEQLKHMMEEALREYPQVGPPDW